MKENQSVKKAMHIIDCLIQQRFEGMSLSEIAKVTDIPAATVLRILHTLKGAGWIIETHIASEKNSYWKISDALLRIAHAYKTCSLEKVKKVHDEYFEVTGMELTH